MKQTRIKILPLSLILLLLIGLSACRNDDDQLASIPERDRAEQQIVDKDSLQGYLQTHYYNSGDFAASMNPTIDDLVITELEPGESLPDGHTLLIDAVETHNTVLLEVDYEYYVLRLNQGGGQDSPKFPDQVRVNYTGYLLDGTLFDSSANSVVFDLSALVPGWSRAVPQFNNAENFVLNGDGTVTFNNAGVGVMFLPSGLGYYSGGAASIQPYSNLWFAFDLYQSQENDHDNDGIPSYVEDLNNDIDLSNDDTDDNTLANFIDPNDDGDSVLTRNELEPREYIIDTNMGEEEPVLASDEFEVSRTEEAGIITINTVKIVDSNSDGIPDYLDDNIEIDYSEED